MATVQFYGKEQVMEAAANMKATAWAIFSGTALFMKWETKDQTESEQALEQALDMLHNAGTVAVYKIKFFEVPEGVEKIKINEKTVCDAGSFSFKTQTQNETIMPYVQRGALMQETNAKLDKVADLILQQQEKITQLEEKISEIESADLEEEPEETIGSVLIDAIKNPDKLMNLISTVKMITGIGGNNQQTVAAIGNVTAQNNNAPGAPVIDPSSPEYQARVQRMCAAIDTLEKADPLLVEHLEKLADMATNNNSQFNWLIKML